MDAIETRRYFEKTRHALELAVRMPRAWSQTMAAFHADEMVLQSPLTARLEAAISDLDTALARLDAEAERHDREREALEQARSLATLARQAHEDGRSRCDNFAQGGGCLMCAVLAEMRGVLDAAAAPPPPPTPLAPADRAGQ